jgi:hypothetical protein
MADILITPASSLMAFTSSLNYKQTLTQEASGSLTLLGSGSTGRTDLFTVNGNNGTLFSISDDLSNSLFSVNTIAGLPVIEAFADNSVIMGAYGQNVFVINGNQVSIGTSTPETSAVFQIDSFTQGFIPPRMSNTAMNNIVSPANGLIVYDKDNDTLNVYNGSAWQALKYV